MRREKEGWTRRTPACAAPPICCVLFNVFCVCVKPNDGVCLETKKGGEPATRESGREATTKKKTTPSPHNPPQIPLFLLPLPAPKADVHVAAGQPTLPPSPGGRLPPPRPDGRVAGGAPTEAARQCARVDGGRAPGDEGECVGREGGSLCVKAACVWAEATHTHTIATSRLNPPSHHHSHRSTSWNANSPPSSRPPRPPPWPPWRPPPARLPREEGEAGTAPPPPMVVTTATAAARPQTRRWGRCP